MLHDSLAPRITLLPVNDHTPDVPVQAHEFLKECDQVNGLSGTNATPLAHAPLSEGSWVRFSVHSDYAAKQWALYVNGGRIAANLGFFDTGAAAYTEFAVRGAGSSNAPIDSITIDTNAPALNAVKCGTVVFGR
mgnify:CR=1 FL=1